jgi:mevalonate kinase
MSEVLYHRKAHGKLLITGEYFVLDGCTALALPTKYGQTLTVEKSDFFHWNSTDEFGFSWLEIFKREASQNQASTKLCELLNLIGEASDNKNYRMTTDFNKEWGLGSSSTLVALLADFFQLNPYELNQKIFRGSGYDIACAFSDSPILYTSIDKLNPTIQSAEIPKEIKPYLYFVYLGKKQNSRTAIDHYSSTKIDTQQVGHELSQISESLLKTINISEWVSLLEEHENLISRHLNLEKVSTRELKDLPYFSKSLGAWGGDFALVISDHEPITVRENIHRIGFQTVLSYQDLFE